MMDTEEKYKVVIIDDERSASDALRRELEPYREFEIKGIASSGAKGKKMIMELHPDLLFLDVELPDILGLNLLSEIKDDVLWDMKVVFYTSYDKYLLQALRESAFDFLLKPFSAEDLKVVIDRYRKARLNLKRNTKAEDIVSYSQAFVQISQSAIVNVNYLAMIDGKCCQLYPPFHDKGDLVISRSYLKELQERFYVL